MENLTCIIDAITLVDRIHEIKQWVYNDTIRILIPLCTFDKVEKLFKASIAPKEVQKEPASKKPSLKAARKEQRPLFDINPRSAKEFLVRVQGATDTSGVTFQKNEEQFTQWKVEEKQAVQAEQSPVGPPTSFAQALLRKLNTNDTSNDSKVPSKPRLVARSTSPKSPWKYHKVPTISAEGVPEDLKGLFSCILWRLHEFENNPLKPENFVLLSNDNKTTSAAQKIDIPVKDFAGLRDALLRETASNDHRAEFGELESIFPSKKEATITTNGYIQVSEKIDNTDNGLAFAIEEVLGQDEEVTELKRTQRMEQAPKSVTFQEGHVNGITESAEAPEDTANAMETDLTSLSKSVMKEPLKVRFEQGPGTSIESDSNSERLGQTMTTSSPPASEDGGNALGSADENENGTPDSSPEKPGQAQEPAIPVEEDSDDDEEVVVFKPRSRRASGLLKSAPEPEKSKVEPIVQPTVQPMAQVTPAQKIVKTQIESTLKPQSPVFVPRNVQVNDQPPPQPKDNNITPVTQPTAMDQDEDQAQVCIGNAVKDKPEEKVQEKVIPRSPRSHHPQLHPVPHPQKKLLDLNSKRNEGLIQRQREAIHRQAQATRPQPRKIQLHPTASPTVIDPDDFDRSYVVQPRVHTGAPANGVHRGGRRGSPKRAPRTPEPEVDFVLKSGSPRGSMRGKGKLWVP